MTGLVVIVAGTLLLDRLGCTLSQTARKTMERDVKSPLYLLSEGPIAKNQTNPNTSFIDELNHSENQVTRRANLQSDVLDRSLSNALKIQSVFGQRLKRSHVKGMLYL